MFHASTRRAAPDLASLRSCRCWKRCRSGRAPCFAARGAPSAHLRCGTWHSTPTFVSLLRAAAHSCSDVACALSSTSWSPWPSSLRLWPSAPTSRFVCAAARRSSSTSIQSYPLMPQAQVSVRGVPVNGIPSAGLLLAAAAAMITMLGVRSPPACHNTGTPCSLRPRFADCPRRCSTWPSKAGLPSNRVPPAPWASSQALSCTFCSVFHTRCLISRSGRVSTTSGAALASWPTTSASRSAPRPSGHPRAHKVLCPSTVLTRSPCTPAARRVGQLSRL